MPKPALKSPLRPHQQRVVERIQREDQPGLVVAHGLGSGKTLTSIAAQAALGVPGTVVVPASLQENYAKEIRKHVRGNPSIKIRSLQGTVTKGTALDSPFLVVDEAHRSRDPKSQTRKVLGEAQAAKRMLLTASPMYNHPSDIAPLINIAAGSQVLPEDKKSFEGRYIEQKRVNPGVFDRLRGVKPGAVPVLNPGKKKEMAGIFSKWVDYHPSSEEGFPSRVDETVKVPMTTPQLRTYDSLMGQAPAWVRRKVLAGLPPSKTEAKQLNAFMTAARQVSLSTAPYQREGTAYDAPKIDRAFSELRQDLASNPRHKTLIYSSYLGAGLTPYEERLQSAGIEYGRFTGDMSKKKRDQEVRDFNSGKKRVMFISRAGGEGLDLRGTRAVQVLEPHWNEEAIKQVVGRAIRYKSHDHLPENEREVKVQRYVATRSPKGLMERYGLRKPGLSADEYLLRMSQSKEDLNRQFHEVMTGSMAKAAAERVHRVPKALEHRAQAIMRRGHDQQSAYAIATAASQREGRLKKGTHKLTRKGRGWEAEHQKEAQELALKQALGHTGRDPEEEPMSLAKEAAEILPRLNEFLHKNRARSRAAKVLSHAVGTQKQKAEHYSNVSKRLGLSLSPAGARELSRESLLSKFKKPGLKLRGLGSKTLGRTVSDLSGNGA